jgi:hypothetical protein
MRLKYWILPLVLVSCAALWGQQGEQRPGAEPDAEQQEPQAQKEEQRRPTLGRAPTPSLRGLGSSTTADFRKLLRIRTIYVESIDNFLSDKLVDGLPKIGRFRIVTNRSEDDAVLRGTCFDSRHLKSVHSEVYLNDRTSGSSIWQDSIRLRYGPPPLAKVVETTATEILANLSESIQEAQRK